jgi:hypothetical protein
LNFQELFEKIQEMWTSCFLLNNFQWVKFIFSLFTCSSFLSLDMFILSLITFRKWKSNKFKNILDY